MSRFLLALALLLGAAGAAGAQGLGQGGGGLSVTPPAGLPLTGGTVSGTLSLTGAGTALNVTNNASVGTLSAASGAVTTGTDPNGTIALGSVSVARTPYIDFRSTGTGTNGFRIISEGADSLRFASGSSGAFVGRFEAATGFTAPLFGVSQPSLTWSGTTNPSPFSSSITISGATTAATPQSINNFAMTELTLAASPTVYGIGALYNYGGGTGSRVGLNVTLVQQQGANTDTGADKFYVGSAVYGFARFSPPGATSAAPLGRVFGFNATGAIQGGFTATNYFQVASAEFNVSISTGSTAAIRSGVTIADLVGAAQGFWSDNMLWLYGGGQKWRYGVMLGDSQSWPMDTTAGTILGAKMGATNSGTTPFATKWGVDWVQVAFPATGNPYDGGFFRTNGASLDGAGTLQLGSTYFTSSSSGLAVDAKGSVGTGATIAAAGSGYVLNAVEVFTTAYGGVWKVTVNSSGIPTTITQLSAPSISSLTPPANPIAAVNQYASDPGTGLTLNLTWNTTATTLALQPGAGPTTVGGTLNVTGAVSAPSIGNGASAFKISGSGQWSANGVVATTMTSLGPTGSHTTIQEWLTVTDSAGVVRYVPAY